MLHGNNRLTRLIAAGLAIAAIAPAASVPQPIDGQGPGPVAVSVLRSGTCFRRIGERRTRPVPRAARRMGGTPRLRAVRPVRRRRTRRNGRLTRSRSGTRRLPPPPGRRMTAGSAPASGSPSAAPRPSPPPDSASRARSRLKAPPPPARRHNTLSRHSVGGPAARQCRPDHHAVTADRPDDYPTASPRSSSRLRQRSAYRRLRKRGASARRAHGRPDSTGVCAKLPLEEPRGDAPWRRSRSTDSTSPMSAPEAGRCSCSSTAMSETGRRRGGGSSTRSPPSSRSSLGTSGGRSLNRRA